MNTRIVNALWGGAGVLVVSAITTTLENRQAIAVLDNKVVEAKALDKKIDKLAENVDLSLSRIAMVRGDLASVSTDVDAIRANQSRNAAIARCDSNYDTQSKRDECYGRYKAVLP